MAEVALGDELTHISLGPEMYSSGTPHHRRRFEISVNVDGCAVVSCTADDENRTGNEECQSSSTRPHDTGAGTAIVARSTAGGVAEAGVAGAVDASGMFSRSVG